jgi:transposase-like protein
MRRFVEGADRGQTTLFPVCLEMLWVGVGEAEQTCCRRDQPFAPTERTERDQDPIIDLEMLDTASNRQDTTDALITDDAGKRRSNGNYALDLASNRCHISGRTGEAVMDIDLTNPIFHDEAKATAHMEADRWSEGVHCPLCGSVNVHRMGGKTQAGMFLCNDCREKFTVRTGTIFERSHIPLHKWLMATHIMAASKKSVSALQLQRMLGLGSYRTAWFMCHRVREAMKPAMVGPIGGQGRTVESDETLIGGKKKNRAYAKKEPKKHTVLALVDRDGDSRSFHIADVTAKTLREKIAVTADRKSYLVPRIVRRRAATDRQ